jgi:MFS family permease
MLNRFRPSTRYPSQIWLLFGGTLTGSAGLSLIWPYLTITIRERAHIPLTQITLLFMLQSGAALLATTLLGPIMDRFGRKRPMLLGLLTSGLVLAAMSQAVTLAHWAVLLALYGAVNMMFRIGSYAMVADLVESDQRASVYALLRMGDNLGIVLGPAMGGVLASVSYTLSYLIAASTQFVLLFMVGAVIHETLAGRESESSASVIRSSGGYGVLLRDRAFLSVWGLYILVQVANSIVFMLLGLYVKESYQISEARFGLIVGANAVMVVALQYGVTRRTTRYAALPVMALGALFYAGGSGIFALSQGFAGFLLGMIVLTCGELVIVPTATAYSANLAPPHMRARYMGAFSLSFRIGAGIGPLAGGLLSDQIAPVATWYGGMLSCLIAAAGFAFLARRWASVRVVEPEIQVSG